MIFYYTKFQLKLVPTSGRWVNYISAGILCWFYQNLVSDLNFSQILNTTLLSDKHIKLCLTQEMHKTKNPKENLDGLPK